MPENDQIFALLASDNPDDIREGAYLAGKKKMQEALPALVEHLSTHNIAVQEAVERALYKIGGPKVVEAVIPLLRSDDAPARNTAMELLRRLSSSNIEALTRLLRDDDPDIRIFTSDILGSTGSSIAVAALSYALLHDPEVNVRYQAAVSLGELALPGAAASLNKAMQDEEWVQFAVIEALTKIRDESSVSALVQALDKSSDLVGSMIVDALGEMGNMRAVPLLLKHLESASLPLGNKIVRAVVNILGEQSLTLLGSKVCERLRDHIHHAVKDEDSSIQDAAVKAFASLKGNDATESIMKLAGTLDPEEDAERIGKIISALTAIGVNDALLAAVRGDNDLTMQIAVEVMARLEDPHLLPMLVEMFWHRDRDTQRFLVNAMADRADKSAQNFFLDVLDRHKDGLVLRGALRFLGHMGDPGVVQDKVLSFLDNQYNDVKETALEAAVALNTPKIHDHFRKTARSDDPAQRMMAVYAFGMFGPQLFMEELRNALGDECPDVRRLAVEALSRDYSGGSESLHLIESQMADKNKEVRLAVVEALGTYDNEEIYAHLIRGLRDEDDWVRSRCIDKLGERKSQESVPTLIEMLEDESRLIVMKAIEALGQIGGEVAFRALMELLGHPSPETQEAAEAAIENIRLQAGE